MKTVHAAQSINDLRIASDADCALGGPSKELWIMLAVAIPATLLTIIYAAERGLDYTVPAI